MRRLRLQIALMLRAESASQTPSSFSQPHQEYLQPWLQVCTDVMTLQELADQIVEKFSRIYAGRGTLDIKHLETDYGEILDLTDTVGEVFDDRAPSGENRTSIVRVACRPPISSARETSARSGSLMPESSARPKKRSGSSLLLDSQTPLPTIEGWNSQHSSATYDEHNKRRKIESYKHLNGVSGTGHRQRQDSSTQSTLQGHVQVRGSQNSPHGKDLAHYEHAISPSHHELRPPYINHDTPYSRALKTAKAIDHDHADIQPISRPTTRNIREYVHNTPPHVSQKAPFTEPEITTSDTLLSNIVVARAHRRSVYKDCVLTPPHHDEPEIPASPSTRSSRPASSHYANESAAPAMESRSNRSQSSQQKAEALFESGNSNVRNSCGAQNMHAANHRSRSRSRSLSRLSSAFDLQDDDEILQDCQATNKIDANEANHDSNHVMSNQETEIQQDEAQMRTVDANLPTDQNDICRTVRKRAEPEIVSSNQADAVRLARGNLEADRQAQEVQATGGGDHQRRESLQGLKGLYSELARAKELEGRQAAEEYLAKKRAQRWIGQAESLGTENENVKKEDDEKSQAPSPVASTSASSTHTSLKGSLPGTPSLSAADQASKTDPTSFSDNDADSEDSSSSIVSPSEDSTDDAASSVEGKTGSTSPAQQIPATPQRLTSPLSTDHTDDEGTASAQLRKEYRASMSPDQSRKTAREAKSEKFRYPKLSEMMQDRPSQRNLPQSASSKEPPEHISEDDDINSDADADESSNSDEEGLGSSMMKGLRSRMMSSVS